MTEMEYREGWEAGVNRVKEGGIPYYVLDHIVACARECQQASDILNEVFDELNDIRGGSERYLEGFVQGVVEAWDEIADEI